MPGNLIISSLYIHPLKSGAAVSLNEMQLTEQGPVNDRQWMIVQKKDSGLYQMKRQSDFRNRETGISPLATLKPIRFGDHFITLETPSRDTFSVSVNRENPDTVIKARMFNNDDVVAVHDAGDRAAEFISEHLGGDYRLVCKANELRGVDAAWSAYDNAPVSLADGFPLLVTNESSLESLKQHFTDNAELQNISMTRFRPNIVISGLAPWQEDGIASLDVGGVTVDLQKPCSRCAIPTIDQDTGEWLNKEPISSLTQTRRGLFKHEDKSQALRGVFFGQNGQLSQGFEEATIRVGQNIEVTATKTPHAVHDKMVLRYEG